jgi:hypothetical protein
MNWMSQNGVLIDTSTQVVMLRDPTDQKGFLVQLPRQINLSSEVHAVQAKVLTNIPVVSEFPDVFPNESECGSLFGEDRFLKFYNLD